MNWAEFLKWVLIVNGGFLLLYLILVAITGRDKVDEDWDDSDRKQ